MMNRFEIINKIIDNHDLSSTQKCILVALWRFSDKDNKSYPSVETLLKSSGIANKGTFYKNRDKLIELGYLKVETIKGKGCIYEIVPSPKLNMVQNDTVPSNVLHFSSTKSGKQTESLTEQEQINYNNISPELLSYLNGGYLMEISSI